jgi:hypothetical protein
MKLAIGILIGLISAIGVALFIIMRAIDGEKDAKDGFSRHTRRPRR